MNRRPTWWFRSCPRCGGDLYQTTETDDIVIFCLQCGHEVTEEQMTRLRLGLKPARPAVEAQTPTRKAA